MKTNLLLCICFILLQHIQAQTESNQNLVRSTTGVSGSSVKVTQNNKVYVIQHSIGQPSAIGTFNKDNYILRQGFIQPNVLARIKDKNMPSNLQLSLYPNPFQDNISLSFNEEVKGEINIMVFDILGRLVFEKKYIANQNVNVILDKLSSGEYILKAVANQRQFITKILKR